MKIKILKTTKAASCPRGIHTKEYIKDEVCEIFDDLAKVFIKEGWGEAVTAKKVEDNTELKALRAEAKELKITSSHLMGIDKLKEAIEAKKDEADDEADDEAEKVLPTLDNKAITNIDNK